MVCAFEKATKMIENSMHSDAVIDDSQVSDICFRSLFFSKWPKFDENLVKDDVITI